MLLYCNHLWKPVITLLLISWMVNRESSKKCCTVTKGTGQRTMSRATPSRRHRTIRKHGRLQSMTNQSTSGWTRTRCSFCSTTILDHMSSMSFSRFKADQ